MKIKSVIMLVVVVALVFGIGGYAIGSNTGNQKSSEEYKEAYIKGWSHWFSGYGMNGEGMAYIDYYENGRNYNGVFSNVKDAFYAGYKDGFYFVNHSEPDELYNEGIEKAYTEYFSW